MFIKTTKWVKSGLSVRLFIRCVDKKRTRILKILCCLVPGNLSEVPDLNPFLVQTSNMCHRHPVSEVSISDWDYSCLSHLNFLLLFPFRFLSFFFYGSPTRQEGRQFEDSRRGPVPSRLRYILCLPSVSFFLHKVPTVRSYTLPRVSLFRLINIVFVTIYLISGSNFFLRFDI